MRLAPLVPALALWLVLAATPAAAVNIHGAWSICFPSQGVFNCGPFTGTMTATGNAFTITVDPICSIHGTVDATTGNITVPAGECPQAGLFSFTGTATDTTFNASADFALCPTFTNVTAVRACPACDDGNSCTTDGCGATPCSAPSSSCTIANVPTGWLCNDGFACTTGDTCQGGTCAGTPVVCDDGNPCTDDACDPGTGTCTFTPNDAPCNDGAVCTTNDTCSGGVCVGGPPLECAPCETCRPLAGCVKRPALGCRATLGRGKLQLKDDTDDTRDRVKWSWGRGSATSAGDLGNPLGSDDYTLCIFDDAANTTPRLFLGAAAPAGGTCANGTSCWRGRGTPAGSKGFVYKDSQLLLPDGLKKVQLKPGLDGKAKASAAGAGAELALPSPMNVTLPVVVQLQGENGACFETTITSATQSETTFIGATTP
jgi:hypothetical protein